MSILKNAIDSIALGVEDYENEDPRRLISCVRNIYAGVLLLFKHKLELLSPPDSNEVLLKKDIMPVADSATGIRWQGRGNKTVDTKQIKERFKNLEISVDWKRVDKMSEHRNNLEHYHSSLSQDAVRTLVADSFAVIRDFIRVELHNDPLKLLGETTWTALTTIAEVYDKEKEDCILRLETIDWKYEKLMDALLNASCGLCGSGLIDVVKREVDRDSAEFLCRSCGHIWSFEEFAANAISEHFSWLNYREVKDGGDPLIVACPVCGSETYDTEDDICLICDETVERECQVCGAEIPVEELDDSGLCGYCNHTMGKDD